MKSETPEPLKSVILHIYHGFSLEGGASRSLLYLIKGLDHSRFHPVVCCLYDSNVVPHFRSHGIDAFAAKGIEELNHTTAGWYPLHNPVSAWQFLRKLVLLIPFALRTRAIIKERKADLVHLNSLTLLPSAVGAKLAGVPLVWHVRESVRRGHLGVRRRLLRWLVNILADEVIYICEDNRRSLDAKGVVIYNFVDFREFDRDISGQKVREELNIGSGGKVVLMLGGISRIKGTLELVKAMSLVRKRMPEAHCIISGCFSVPLGINLWLLRFAKLFGYKRYTERVKALVKKEALEKHVTFLPFRSDVPQLIAASDLVAFPSKLPHFARPVIEAGAMAKPVVASRIGGVEEAVEHGITGVLVPPGDVEALADAILQVLRDKEMAARLGSAGFVRACQAFDAGVNIAQTMRVYERLLGTRQESPLSAELIGQPEGETGKVRREP